MDFGLVNYCKIHASRNHQIQKFEVLSEF
uniref:Uncharacterized protein n=1 Tax=Rhizophora mucronata TaxID=61149 RepID=A0A2P2PES1_RHIMU